MSLVLITLQAQYQSGVTAAPASGYVVVTPKQWRASTTDNIIYVAEPVRTALDDTGSLILALGSRDTDTDPAYVYAVDEFVDNVKRSYEITLPTTVAGSVVNLADLQPDGTWLAADVKPGGFGGF